MALNTINTDAISFKKLSGKAHTQQNFAVSEESISSNIQLSYTTVFAELIDPLPITNGGLSTVGSTDGVVKHVKFNVEIIPDTQIAAGRSQGYRLKLQSSETVSGVLYPAGTILNSALGKLQIVPSLYGTVKPDGSTEYDPILYQTNGTTQITKFDPINWYLDFYNGVLFVQDPPSGYDTSALRPGVLEAFLYVGDYVSDILQPISGQTGTTASNVGGGVGVFKEKTLNDLRFKSFLGTNGIAVTGTTDNIILSFTGSSGGGTITGATNGLSAVGANIVLGGILTSATTISGGTQDFNLGTFSSPISNGLIQTTGNFFVYSFNDGLDRLRVGGKQAILETQESSTGQQASIQMSSSGFGTTSYIVASGSVNTWITQNPDAYYFTSSYPQFRGVEYDVDYSANFGPRSIPDVGWVTGYTSSASTNVFGANGLTKIGNNIVLGGTLTGNTFIEGSLTGSSIRVGTVNRLDDIEFENTGSTSFTSYNTTLLCNGFFGSTNTSSSFGVNSTSGLMQFGVSFGGGLFIEDQAYARGVRYLADYSAQFTPRSLVDKAYVTGLTSSIVTVADNGLHKVGNTIVLGGSLTGNTSILGNSRNLNLGFTTGKFQITGSTWNFSWDTQNKRFLAGDNCVATGGSLTYTFGDTNVNNGSFGSVMFGELSTIDANVGSALAVGESVWIRAYGGKSIGRGSRVNAGGGFSLAGGAWIPGGTDPKTNNKVPQTGGFGAFGFYNTDGGQTDNHGALGAYSAILGGKNHNIPANSTSSAIIGGDTIKVASGVTNTVHLPKVRIGLGVSATMTTGSTSPDVLVRNQTTGEIEIAAISNPVVANNNFVFGTGTGIGAHTSQYTANENVLVVMTQSPPTINSGTNINNVFVFGESITLNGAPTNGGTITDTGIFGFGHIIGDGTSFFGGSAGFVYGNNNQNYGNGALVGGQKARVLANIPFGGAYETGAVAIGLTTQLTGSELVTAYRNAVNISSNSTGQTAGHGAYGSLSVILGGQDHNIPVGNKNSAIIGGDRIKAPTGVTNTVYLPKVRIGLGQNASLATDNANPNLLVLNSVTGEIEVRQAITITGGTGASAQNVYSLKRIVTGSTTLTSNDFVIFCNGVAPMTLLAPASPIDGQVYKIKDVSGSAGTNNITVSGNGKNIDGASTVQINTDRGGVEIVFDSTLDFWSVMNFVS